MPVCDVCVTVCVYSENKWTEYNIVTDAYMSCVCVCVCLERHPPAGSNFVEPAPEGCNASVHRGHVLLPAADAPRHQPCQLVPVVADGAREWRPAVTLHNKQINKLTLMNVHAKWRASRFV